MVRISQIIDYIETFAPLSLQGDFDNCGLKVGNIDCEATGIMITLDTNVDVVKEAIEKNCNLIIEHHPSIWGKIDRLDYKLPLTKALELAIKNDIVVYSSHTNIDFCEGGLNDYVAKQMGLASVHYANIPADPRIGELKNVISLGEYAKFLSELFDDKNVTTIGDINKKIKKVAVVNGGGGGHADDLLVAIDSGADVFVTGDVKYSVARLAKDINYAIIQIGHYNSEQGFLPLMSELLAKKFDFVGIYQAKSLQNPFN